MTTNPTAFKTTQISATSRASVKIGESYFTFEASETRTVDYTQLPKNLEDAEKIIKNEYEALFNTVNEQVDLQIADIKSYTKK